MTRQADQQIDVHSDASIASIDADTKPGRRRSRRGPSLSAHGEPMVWLIGGGMAICTLMILALLALIVYQGAMTFWPRDVLELTTDDGRVVLGSIARSELFEAGQAAEPAEEELELDVPDEGTATAEGQGQDEADEQEAGDPELEAPEGLEPDDEVAELERAEAGALGLVRRDLIQIGNRELTGTPFEWVSEAAVSEQRYPEWAIFAERRTWGPMVGFPDGFLIDGQVEADSPEAVWALFQEHHPQVLERARERRSLERVDMGRVSYEEERARLAVVEARLRHGQASDEHEQALSEFEDVRAWASERYIDIREQIDALNEENQRYELVTDLSVREDYENENIGWTDEDIEHSGRLNDPVGSYARWRLIAGTLRVRIGPSPDDEDREPLLIAEDDGQGNLTQTGGTAELVAGSVDGRNLNWMLQLAEPVDDGLEVQADYHLQQQRVLALDQITRAFPANQLTLTDKLGVYLDRWREFLTERPREANTEGGVLPPMIGTVTMTLLMCFMGVPFGVLAALYLREYARPGPIVSAVRIAVNNLAGVPSIVFGVFGLGFFCYIVGDFVDSGPASPAGDMQWVLALGVLVLLAIAAMAATFFRIRLPDSSSFGPRAFGYLTAGLWLTCVGVVVWLVMFNPFFSGFFPAQAAEGNPVFNKGGLLWASLTLALLTLPEVIVSTEEALSAVPGSMREGSYACGASKWQTVRRIVLPRAMPGMMTGTILAMARGAGEVAPLMLVGAVTMTQELPIDTTPPFIHLDRSFMHLGFHIYDVGFQSPDSEGARPMVYTTTLLLIAIIAALNMSAFFLRTRLRRRFADSTF